MRQGKNGLYLKSGGAGQSRLHHLAVEGRTADTKETGRLGYIPARMRQGLKQVLMIFYIAGRHHADTALVPHTEGVTMLDVLKISAHPVASVATSAWKIGGDGS